jgi:hypothetical protein
MTWYSRVLIVFLLVPLQTLIFEKARIGGVKPDLGLVLAFVWGWMAGGSGGLLYGSALGAMLDLFSVGVPSLNLFLKMTVGLASGILGHTFANMAFWIKPLVLYGFSVLHDLSGSAYLGDVEIILTPQHPILIRALYNSLLGALLLWVWQPDETMGEVRVAIQKDESR